MKKRKKGKHKSKKSIEVKVIEGVFKKYPMFNILDFNRLNNPKEFKEIASLISPGYCSNEEVQGVRCVYSADTKGNNVISLFFGRLDKAKDTGVLDYDAFAIVPIAISNGLEGQKGVYALSHWEHFSDENGERVHVKVSDKYIHDAKKRRDALYSVIYTGTTTATTIASCNASILCHNRALINDATLLNK